MQITILNKDGSLDELFLNYTVKVRPAYDKVFYANINNGDRVLYFKTEDETANLGVDAWILKVTDEIAVDGSYVYRWYRA